MWTIRTIWTLCRDGDLLRDWAGRVSWNRTRNLRWFSMIPHRNTFLILSEFWPLLTSSDDGSCLVDDEFQHFFPLSLLLFSLLKLRNNHRYHNKHQHQHILLEKQPPLPQKYHQQPHFFWKKQLLIHLRPITQESSQVLPRIQKEKKNNCFAF